MGIDKKLTIKQKARLKKIEKEMNENRETFRYLISEFAELKTEKAVLLCPFKIDDLVIRDDGLLGVVSKIKLAGDQLPVISVFKERAKTHPYNDQKFNSEHYRTKRSENWRLA